MTTQPPDTRPNFDWKEVIDAALTECGLERIAPLKVHQRGSNPVFTAPIVPVERWRAEAKTPRIIREMARRGVNVSVTELPRPEKPFERPPVGSIEFEALP